MRKLLSWLTVASMVLLSACGGGGGSNESASSQPSAAKEVSGEQKKLTFWFIEPGKRKEVLEVAVKRFEEKNPGVKVEAVQIPNDAYKTKLSVAIGGGDAPDVFHSWGGGWLKQFVDAGQVLDISGKVNKDDYLPVAINNATFNDKVYGAPLGVSIVPFYYNKEIFAKFNLEIPKTYEEFIKVAETLRSNGIEPIAMANQAKWPGLLLFAYVADRVAGSDLFRQSVTREAKFDDPGYAKAGEILQDMAKKEMFNKGFNGLSYDNGQSRQLMYTGKAAMELQTSSYVNAVKTENPAFVEKLGMFPFPAIEGGQGNPTNVVGGTSPIFSVSANSKNAELALALIKELTSVETAQQFTDGTGALVAVKGVEYKDPFAIQAVEMLNNAEFMQTFYDQTLPPELAELQKDLTQSVLGLSITPEDAAKQMEQKAAELLK
ncbi:extracellular solute-binding protein [Ammoniphilus sp. YIM 78166]|uniref:extracellular solute-binding protein n=1 Tax=Ammoniphilus sp. YIM 78166 TaxID=1644106 RepID=UPI00107037F8|nr:extracellular solute-binding protein [Ammoniphilus sp. YIM 78166]